MTTRNDGWRRPRQFLVWAIAITWLPNLACAGESLKEKVLAEGQDDYAVHCAACHGETGKGDGPMAKLLVRPPTDITTLRAANGGTFPFWRVFDIVTGSSSVAGHDTFQMPHFWARFRSDDYRLGYRDAHIRVLLLTHYIESIQAKEK